MIFDLDNILPHFANIPRSHYLGELLWNASTPELREFKKVVKAHQKNSKFIPDSAFKPNGSAHDTIIAAINFSLSKRSNLYNVCNALFPIKKFTFWFAGFSLEKHPNHGVRYKHRNRKILLFTKRFWLSHWQFLIKTAIAIIGLAVVIVGLYLKLTGKI